MFISFQNQESQFIDINAKEIVAVDCPELDSPNKQNTIFIHFKNAKILKVISSTDIYNIFWKAFEEAANEDKVTTPCEDIECDHFTFVG